jgi:hypothetical protein
MKRESADFACSAPQRWNKLGHQRAIKKSKGARFLSGELRTLLQADLKPECQVDDSR